MLRGILRILNWKMYIIHDGQLRQFYRYISEFKKTNKVLSLRLSKLTNFSSEWKIVPCCEENTSRSIVFGKFTPLISEFSKKTANLYLFLFSPENFRNPGKGIFL